MMMKKYLFTLTLSFLSLGLFWSGQLQAQNCINGFVFEDLNNNALQDPGEAGLAGQTIRLELPDGSNLTVLSNLDGAYEFCNLVTGFYTLTILNLGSGTLSNPPAHSFDYLAGDNLEPFNFGLLNLSDFGQVNGLVYLDANRNGIHEVDEPLLEDQTLLLTGNGLDISLNTNAYGELVFEFIPNGSYTLRAPNPPPNTVWSNGGLVNFTIVGGQTVIQSFGLQAANNRGVISDIICYDFNANGINDGPLETGIYGRTIANVNLFDEQGALIGQTSPDARGRYGFAGVLPGNYTVNFNFDDTFLLPTTPTNYDVVVTGNDDLRPGPFYGQPRRKRVHCGMTVSTFGSVVSGNKVLSIKDTRNHALGLPNNTGTTWTPPTVLDDPSWTISKMGEVFGIATDEAFHTYVTATSIPVYVQNFQINLGDPLVYKIDPYTLLATPYLYAAATTTVGTDNIASADTGLGNITYNSSNKVLYVTNMTDGTIVVIGSEQHGNPGKVLQVYNVASFTPASVLGEDVWGIGFNLAENKVYFSSPNLGANRAIFSVDINTANGFIQTGTEQQQFTRVDIPVADLAFCSIGQNMLIAERLANGPHSSSVYQHTGSSLAWGAPQKIYVGVIGNGSNSAGGVDYLYDSFPLEEPPAGGCNTFIAASGNLAYIPGFRVYGYQITPATGNLPPSGYNTASYTDLNSIFIDNDNEITSGDKFFQGDVEVFDCACPPDDCALENGLQMLPNSPLDPQGVGGCCVSLDFSNTGLNAVFGISLTLLDGVEFQPGYTIGAGLSTPNFTNSSMVITPAALGPLPNSIGNLTSFCLKNVYATPQFLVIDYLDANYAIFCTDTLVFTCPPEDPCLQFVTDSLVCDTAGYLYTVDFVVPPGSDIPGGIGYIELNLNPNMLPAGATITPTGYTFSPKLQPGDQVTLTYVIGTSANLYGDSLCVVITAHDDEAERLCCFAYEACIPFPLCDPCPFVDAYARPVSDGQSEYCCFELFIVDTFSLDPNLFTSVQTNIITPGVSFGGLVTLPALVAGWLPSYNTPISPTAISWSHNSGTIPNTPGFNLFDFCVEGTTSTDSIYIEINWLNADSVICTDTIGVYCPYCLTVVEDQLYCDQNGNYVYQFSFTNHSIYPVNAVSLADAALFPGAVGNPGVYLLGATVPPGGTYSGSLPVQLNGNAGDEVCFDIILRQIIGNDINITCCYATHCITLEPCDELPRLLCPDGMQMSDLVCEQVYDPVCGCDDVTYANVCYALNAGVTDWTHGACDPNLVDNGVIVLTAEIRTGGVGLSWTLNDAPANYDFFVIREQAASTGIWTVVATVPANGLALYSFLRLTATTGSISYQIIGVSTGGQLVASNEATVFRPENQALTTVYAYPSPARDDLQVTVNRTGRAVIELVSPQGSVDLRQEADFQGAPVPVTLHQLANGVYLVRLRFADGEVVQQRVVRVRD